MKNKLYAGITLLILGIASLSVALILGISNISDEVTAEARSRQAADVLFRQITGDDAETDAVSEADIVAEPDEAFIEIDGSKYIGIVTIPKLSLELPVLYEMSEEGLKTAPCHYSGSVDKNDLVIAAHNYASHFGTLYTLSAGDEVYFTEVDGKVTKYGVVEKETLRPYETERMTDSEYDLTLFTCTVGGRRRVTVRCEKVIE